jgi:rhamnosyltransferase
MPKKKHDNDPKVSVIIPTRNGADTLGELLAMLSIQSLKPLEILIVDSSSSDDTVELAKTRGAKVLTIQQEDYDHGGTRAMMAKKAEGNILLFLTQDAIPANKKAIQKIITPLLQDSTVAVAYGRQLPGFDANEFATHLRLFNYPTTSYIRDYGSRQQFGLRTVFSSNSFAAYRKESLETIGFFNNGLIFGEDTCTVGKLLLKGYKVAYVSEAEVYHSHNYCLSEEFKRSFDIGVLHTTENWLIATYGKAEGEGLKFVLSEISYLLQMNKSYLLPLALIRIAAKVIGYKLGRMHKYLPKAIIMNCSLHKLWWKKNTTNFS